MRRGHIMDMGVGVVMPVRMRVGMVVMMGVGRSWNHAKDVIL